MGIGKRGMCYMGLCVVVKHETLQQALPFQELDCVAITGLIRTRTLFNAYTMIFKIEGCLLKNQKH